LRRPLCFLQEGFDEIVKGIENLSQIEFPPNLEFPLEVLPSLHFFPGLRSISSPNLSLSICAPGIDMADEPFL
jgi:hypothetical protein